MTFVLAPFPHVHLAADPTRELITNLLVYGMAVGILGALAWLGCMFWQDRQEP